MRSTSLKPSAQESHTQLQNSAKAKNVAVDFIVSLKNIAQEPWEELTSRNSLQLKIRQEFLMLARGLEEI